MDYACDCRWVLELHRGRHQLSLIRPVISVARRFVVGTMGLNASPLPSSSAYHPSSRPPEAGAAVVDADHRTGSLTTAVLLRSRNRHRTLLKRRRKHGTVLRGA